MDESNHKPIAIPLEDPVEAEKILTMHRKIKEAPKTYTRHGAGGLVLFAPGASVYAFRPNEGSIKQPGEVKFDGLITIHKVLDTRGTKYKAISNELFALRQRLLLNASLTVTWESENENVQLSGKARLSIAGWNAQSVAYACREVNRILKGYPVVYGSRPVWHDFFLTEDGLAYLKGTGCQLNVHVHRSPLEHKLYLFGSTGGRAMCKATFVDMVEKLTVGTLQIGPKYEVDDNCPTALHIDVLL
ncbi:MAG: hypothetical protein Q9187_007148 [Circinaria calcarea]